MGDLPTPALMPPALTLATSIGPVLETLSIVGIFVFAASGALAAARLRQTIVTFAFFAMVTGVGGGRVRDLLIRARVFWVHGPAFAITWRAAGIVALVTPPRPVAWTGTSIAALLYNGLLSSGVSWVLWALVVQRLSANVAGLTGLAVPVAGVLFAWGLLHEQPSNPEWIGIVLIGIALLALQFRRRMPA